MHEQIDKFFLKIINSQIIRCRCFSQGRAKCNRLSTGTINASHLELEPLEHYYTDRAIKSRNLI